MFSRFFRNLVLNLENQTSVKRGEGAKNTYDPLPNEVTKVETVRSED